MLNVDEKLNLLPDQPGIYKFLSASKHIIYVGKAKNLKKRVKSYFMMSHQDERRIKFLLPNIADLEWVVTHTEAEALILEDQLIKLHRPKYNIQLKDDKTYPYFKLTINEAFPRLLITREILKDGALYFGPYTAVMQVRQTLKVINRHFPLRTCSLNLSEKTNYKPCLNYQLKKCKGPCAGKISAESYDSLVQQTIQLLKGNYNDLIRSLKEKMEACAEALKFEEAAVLRNQISAIRHTLQKQRVVSKEKLDRDVFSVIRHSGFAMVHILFIRNGLLLSDDSLFYQQAEQYDDEELIRSAISKLYVSGSKPLPREILLPLIYEGASMLEEYLLKTREKKTTVLSPFRGKKQTLLKLAHKNGENKLKLKLAEIQSDQTVLQAVKRHLKLTRLPKVAECFDISNISGTHNVASMVVWKNNKASKKDYRKYKIKSFEGANDFASMEEVLQRRYRRLIEEQGDFPDLIVIDGGKGQLASAIKILTDLSVDLSQVDVIGLAKGRSEKRAGIEKENEEDYEYVVKPNRKNEIPLIKNSSTLHFLQNIRDEAHRFAITFHRNVRRKKSLSSSLEEIPGIGPTKRKRLLKFFKGIEKIKQASIPELSSVKGISQKDATSIHQYFQIRKKNLTERET